MGSIEVAGGPIPIAPALGRVVANTAIANTETVVMSAATLANALNTIGATIRITGAGTITTGATPGSSIFRFRVGPTTLTGVIAATVTVINTAAITAQPFRLEGEFHVRATGASGTIFGDMIVYCGNTVTGAFTTLNALAGTTATVSPDLTAANKVELTYISGNAGSTATFGTGTIEVVSLS